MPSSGDFSRHEILDQIAATRNHHDAIPADPPSGAQTLLSARRIQPDDLVATKGHHYDRATAHATAGEVTIRWRARAAEMFIVERSMDLREWQVIEPNFGGSAPWAEYVDSPPPGEREAYYYRVRRR